ncbi:MAG: signal peptidase I [Oscillospiraceae bacterium]|nr:signal peptidase I [Oscillospiraceae bacterium]
MKPFQSGKFGKQNNRNKKEKEPNPFEARGLAGTVYFMLHDMVSILAVIVIGFILAARLVGVSGISMYPTLVGEQERMGTGGDYLILRSNFLSSTYEQGDIVVACVPTYENGKPIVKRVIATEGQTVSFRLGSDACLHVYVDDVLQPEEFINEPMKFSLADEGFVAKVPEGCYFLMGDNRNHSYDSRYSDVGMVDGRYIVGKALLLAFPGEDTENGNDRDWKRLGDIYD